MEYTSQEELYNSLVSVFAVKRRLLSITKYNYLTDKDIWLYLANMKWKYAIGLTLNEIINDIINIDGSLVNDYIQGGNKNEENKVFY